MSTSGKFSKIHASAASDTDPIAQLTDVLSSDFTVARADSIIHITLATDATAVFALVASDGTQLSLNGGSTIAADAIHYETFQLDQARTWNLQMLTSGTATWSLLMITELSLV